MTNLCNAALDILATPAPKDKATKTHSYAKQWRANEINSIGITENTPQRPARSAKPELRHPTEMPKRRKAGSTKSKIALLHALAHIELNAIDLAWDIIARFSNYAEENAPQNFSLPTEFFNDWLTVADDEAKHFLLLENRLNDLGASYGDLPAHDGLWEASERTAQDLPARLAIVPMVLEARGLDVTPGMIEIMKSQNDTETAEILQTIHDDEITHVAAGTRWFESWCTYHNRDIEDYWQSLVKKYFGRALKRPFNHPSREEAGMIRDWYEPLADIEFIKTQIPDT